MKRLFDRLRRYRRTKVSRQQGVALLVVVVTTAILGAVVGEFSYNTRVELEASLNLKDQVRAEYLARSGINLDRLVIKVQQKLLDPLRQQFGIDIQLADYSDYLLSAFGGSDDERAGLGGLLGVDASMIKGLGVGKDASFHATMTAEDGKLNIDCGGGLQPPLPLGAVPLAGGQMALTTPQQALYAMLTALFWPPRYNRLFDNPDKDGQYATRDEIARAIIDWTDVDTQRFEPIGGSSGAEDYRYDALKDPYRAHDNFMDTLDEAQLVKGIGDDFWGSFGEMFTVYGGCKINLGAIKPDEWPLAAAIIRVAAKNPTDPTLMDDVKVAALAQQISSMAQMLGGLKSLDDFAAMANSAGLPPQMQQMLGQMQGNAAMQQMQGMQLGMPGLTGIALDPARLKAIAKTGPRLVWRIDSTGTIERPGGKKIQVHIRGVFDTVHFNQNTTSGDANDRMGTWVYWRID